MTDEPSRNAPRRVIATPRLLLRPFLLADIPKVFAMSTEEGMRRWIPDQVYRDLAQAEDVVRALMSYTDRPPDPRAQPYVLGIEDKHAGTLVGHVGVSPARGSVEIGYALEQQLHGRGLATEAVAAMSEWALIDVGVPEVLGIVQADNAPSCRVLEKAGFVRGEEIQLSRGPHIVYRRTSL